MNKDIGGRELAADAEGREAAAGVSRRGWFRWVVAGSLVVVGGITPWCAGVFESASPRG